MKTVLSAIIAFLFLTACNRSKTDTNIATLFAPGNINTHMSERDAALSPNNDMFLFSVQITRQHSAICYSTKLSGKWIRPRVASFSGRYMDIEPVFHPDGRLFFCSNRPLSGETEAGDYNIWFVENIDGDWTEPQALDTIVNSPGNEFYPSFTSNGDIYFTATLPGGKGAEDLWMSEFFDGKYNSPINLGDSINTANFEYNSFIHPDGNYLLFTTHGWGVGYGSGDIYVSFKNEKGEWLSPKNLGEKINTEAFEFCPSLSPDGKTLFFTRRNIPKPETERWSYFEIMASFNSLENGQGNIYSIDANIINQLK